MPRNSTEPIVVKPTCDNPREITHDLSGDVRMHYGQMFVLIPADGTPARIYAKRMESFSSDPQRAFPHWIKTSYVEVTRGTPQTFAVRDEYDKAQFDPVSKYMRSAVRLQAEQILSLECDIDDVRMSFRDVIRGLCLNDEKRYESHLRLEYAGNKQISSILGREYGGSSILDQKDFGRASHVLRELFPTLLEIWDMPIEFAISNAPAPPASAREWLVAERAAAAAELFRRRGILPKARNE